MTISASLRAAVNGGAATTGAQTAYPGQAVILSASPAGIIGADAVRIEIYEYPEGFTVPAGWSTASDGTTFYYAASPAASWSVPANVNLWGKYLFRLVVVSQSVDYEDETCVLTVANPDGTEDTGYLEFQQFGEFRQSAAPAKRNWRRMTPGATWGAYLAPDTSVTIQLSAGSMRCHDGANGTAQAANRTITLGTTGATVGKRFRIVRKNAAAFTLAIINGGGGAGTLYTFASATNGDVWFRYDGTNWAVHEDWTP